MPDFTLETLALISIGLYAVLIVSIGFYVSRQIGDSGDYFLAGRSLTWYLIGLSLLASNMSNTSIIGKLKNSKPSLCTPIITTRPSHCCL